MQLTQNRIAHLKISNIKFNVLRRKSKSRPTEEHSLHVTTPSDLQPSMIQGELVHTRNSFIPRSNIRSQMQFEREKKVNHTPLHPVQHTYSSTTAFQVEFPTRKPKSGRPIRNYFPIYRERLSSCSSPHNATAYAPQEIHSSLKNYKGMEKHYKSFGQGRMRSTNNSCMVLNGREQEKEPFIRYSNSSFKSEHLRNRSHDDKYEEIDRVYF